MGFMYVKSRILRDPIICNTARAADKDLFFAWSFSWANGLYSCMVAACTKLWATTSVRIIAVVGFAMWSGVISKRLVLSMSLSRLEKVVRKILVSSCVISGEERRWMSAVEPRTVPSPWKTHSVSISQIYRTRAATKSKPSHAMPQ